MEMKYGNIPSSQLLEYSKQLHSDIHKLLIFREQNYQNLDKYIENLIFKLIGFNSLLGYPSEMLNLISLLEAIKNENLKKDCDFKTYRGNVFAAHNELDKLINNKGGESDE